MDHTIDYRPAFALLTVSLDEGESIRSEAGSMVSFADGIDIETNANGGLFGSLKRSVLGGESFFQNTFHARTAGDVSLAPPLPGDIVHQRLEDETMYVQSGSYLASDVALDLDTSFGGAKTFFGSEGLFLLKLEGTGDSFLSSYGAIHEVELSDGEHYTVDTGHIVAFDGTATFSVERVGGLKSTLFSGEGLVCTFTGPGTVWLQSRSMDSFLSWLIPKLPSTNTA
ncbi:TIGR00266 family protein [Haloferax sp. MBLA0076]|uniref:TIGR00266 family protein n=1 Tax=Haloferax litoreum TaxID=2666140 RepID=A0A6A8GCX5_9EURY|nr:MULTISPECIES: TIGR00266 family protein [Haloferax]KAB1192537.1 TIGR00266 family protein [Haloferax sp. CBA1148]MRX21008.1 TIGR00266 family protein [Haloferax litoreum]